MATFTYDASSEPTFLDFTDIAAGYGILSVPVDGFLPGDVVQMVSITITGTGLTTILLPIDMVMRDAGYFEWTVATAIDAHFTLTAANVAAIAAAKSCSYAVSISILRNGVQQTREVQSGVISAFSGTPAPPLIVNSIVITGGPVSGNVGQQAQLTATCYDGLGNVLPSASVAWRSSNINVASVDATGRVTFLLPGTSTITASSQGVAASTTATCNDASFLAPTNKQVPAFNAAQSKWLPTTLTPDYLQPGTFGGAAAYHFPAGVAADAGTFTGDGSGLTDIPESSIAGTLSPTRGGTGLTAPAAGSLLVAAGALAMTLLAPGASGQMVRSNGTSWAAGAVVAADISDLATAATGITKLGTISVGTWQGSAIADTYLAVISASGKVANAATTATPNNTPSTIVARDASGNFNAGMITGSLVGNVTGNVTGTLTGSVTGTATTAFALSSARTFALTGDVSGSVSADLSVGMSIAATLGAGVVANANVSNTAAIAYSKLTLTGSIVNADVAAGAAIADSKLATISTAGKVANSATTATNANTASAIVARDASGNFNAGAISLTGGLTAAGTGSRFGDTAVPAGVSATPATVYVCDSANSRFRLVGATGEQAYSGWTSNGTIAVPTALTSGRIILGFSAHGYDGSAWNTDASGINVIAGSDWTLSNHETKLTFTVTAHNSTTATLAAQLDGTGLTVTGAGSFSNGMTVNGAVLAATAGLSVSGGAAVVAALTATTGQFTNQVKVTTVGVGIGIDFKDTDLNTYSAIGFAAANAALRTFVVGADHAGSLIAGSATGDGVLVAYNKNILMSVDGTTALVKLTTAGAAVTGLGQFGALPLPVGVTSSGFLSANDNYALVSPAINDAAARRAYVLAASYGGAARFAGVAHSGTPSAPLTMANASAVATFEGLGYDGTTYGLAGGIRVLTTQAWTSSAHGSQITFSTVANGGTATGVALTLDQDKSATFAGQVTASAGFTVTAGGLTVTAGTVSSTGSDLYVQNDSAAIYLRNGTPNTVGGFYTDFRWAGGSKTDTAFAAVGTLKLYAGNSATPTIAITNTTLGLYGVTPVARQLLATGVSHTVDDVITVLQNVGLARQV